MGAEAAIVRTQFVSGTHAIATALFSVLRPGDEMLAVAGRYVGLHLQCDSLFLTMTCLYLGSSWTGSQASVCDPESGTGP